MLTINIAMWPGIDDFEQSLVFEKFIGEEPACAVHGTGMGWPSAKPSWRPRRTARLPAIGAWSVFSSVAAA